MDDNSKDQPTVAPTMTPSAEALPQTADMGGEIPPMTPTAVAGEPSDHVNESPVSSQDLNGVSSPLARPEDHPQEAPAAQEDISELATAISNPNPTK